MRKDKAVTEEIKGIAEALVNEMTVEFDSSKEEYPSKIYGGKYLIVDLEIQKKAILFLDCFPLLNENDIAAISADFTMSLEGPNRFKNFASKCYEKSSVRGHCLSNEYKNAAVVIVLIFHHFIHEIGWNVRAQYTSALAAAWS